MLSALRTALGLASKLQGPAMKATKLLLLLE